MNNQQTKISKNEKLLNPNALNRNENLFYRNGQPYSSNSLKSTFSDTNREPIDYNKLQDRYATHEKLKQPGTLDRLVIKVKSSLICFPAKRDTSNHRESVRANKVNTNETRLEHTWFKTKNDRKSSGFGFNCEKIFNKVIGLFPIIDSLRNYDLENDFVMDLLAGITVAVLHIPQGMAYGMLAGVGAVNGLYVSFFPVLVYGFLGTSRHVSVGTFAVVSIMLYNTANKMGAFDLNGNDDSITNSLLNQTFLSPVDSSRNLVFPPTPVEVLTSLSFLIGIIMIVMGILNLGVLSLILSDQLITSFSSGAAIHVATSQIGSVFGITTVKYFGKFKLVYSWIDLVKQYNHISYPTLIISVSVLFTLIIFKEFLEQPIRRKFRIGFQIPIDLLVIIIATFVGSQLDWGEVYGVIIMKKIPVGLPEAKLPRTDFLFDIIYDALTITMVIFALLISLGKLYANKFNYKVSPNRELIALGSANLFSSFFLCFPSSASLSRSSVQERSGAKTQLVGIISCIIVLAILLYLAPLFYYLPKCVLACIILVALKGLFVQIGELSRAWRTSRPEGLVWFVTFTSTVLLDVDLGLGIGIIFSLMITLLQFTMPSFTLLGQLPFTDIYVDSELYSKAIQLKGIRIFQFSCPLFFLNCDYFKEQLFAKTLHMPFGELLERMNSGESAFMFDGESKRNGNQNLEGLCDDNLSSTNYGYVDDNQQSITSANQIKIRSNTFSANSSTDHIFHCVYEADNGEQMVHTIIIDCSGISTIDSAGVRCLEDVLKDLKKINLHCYLAACPSPLLLMFKRMKFIDRLPSNSSIFATIHDAVINAFNRTHQLPLFLNQNIISQTPGLANDLQATSTFSMKESA